MIGKRRMMKDIKVAVIGLGYVGLPLAVEFSKKVPTIGFDINAKKIKQYQNGDDPTGELGAQVIRDSGIYFTSDTQKLRTANVFIIAVPTPIHEDNTLDFVPLKEASRLVGLFMPVNSLVVYESTVYPGATEDICIPVLEEHSGMKAGRDFRVGYSPERINPGDKEHALTNVTKIVSGQDEETLEDVAEVYGYIFDEHAAGSIYKAKNIKVAEAAKVVENSQRDINIAFMNETARIMHRIGIDTIDVLNAMNTKWNALGFKPGLVGGHCISIDPYYLIHRAEETNYHANLLMTGRAINEDIPVLIAQETIRLIILSGKNPAEQSVYIAGLTFKGNVNDLRNSQAKRIVDILTSSGLNVEIADPVADKKEVERLFHRTPVELSAVSDADCLIIAAAHQIFADWTKEDIDRLMDKNGAKIIVDVCNIFERTYIEEMGYQYWSL